MEFGKDEVWFRVEKKDRKRFLQFAKDHGCVWMDGEEINPKKHGCGCIMGMSDYHIGFVSHVVLCLCHDMYKIIDFNTIK